VPSADLSEPLDTAELALLTELRAAFREETARVHPSTALAGRVAALRPGRGAAPVVAALAAASVAAVAAVVMLHPSGDRHPVTPASGRTTIAATDGPTDEPGATFEFRISSLGLPSGAEVLVGAGVVPPPDAGTWGSDGIRYLRAHTPAEMSTIWTPVPPSAGGGWVSIASAQLSVEQLVGISRSSVLAQSDTSRARADCNAPGCG